MYNIYLIVYFLNYFFYICEKKKIFFFIILSINFIVCVIIGFIYLDMVFIIFFFYL